MYCAICSKYLSEACENYHLSYLSKEHKVVLFEKQRYNAQCLNHSSEICELYCEQFDVLICATCASSEKQNGHKFIDLIKIIDSKKENIQKDLQEVEKSIYSKYN